MPELNEKMKAFLPLPPRVAGLPISLAGFPVPWFVAWYDGAPDFRVVETGKIAKAVNGRLCWMCGQRLGVYLASVIGPMCAINRTISEPPCHLECAVFAAIACPFLSNPRMRRNAKELPEDRKEAAGNGIDRNPGAVAVWVSKNCRAYQVKKGEHGGNAGVLFQLGDPENVLWFAEGRKATRVEVTASIDSGLPLLEEEAAKQKGGLEELRRRRVEIENLLPRE